MTADKRTDTSHIARYYDSEESVATMTGVRGWLGLARLRQEMLKAFPVPPADVADIGGGTGAQARWLASFGYKVSLADISAGQVAAAQRAPGGELLATATVADARQLPWGNDCFDAALMLGPLYHLMHSFERQAALREASRICRPGAVILLEGLGRLTPLLNLARRGDADARSKADEASLIYSSGAFTNHEGRRDWFTTSFYHTPGDLISETREAGLEVVEAVALEGPLWLLSDLECRRTDREEANFLLRVSEQLSRDPGAVVNTPHFLVVARMPALRGHSNP